MENTENILKCFSLKLLQYKNLKLAVWAPWLIMSFNDYINMFYEIPYRQIIKVPVSLLSRLCKIIGKKEEANI